MISFLILNEFDFKQKAYRKLIVTRVLDYRKKNPARGPVRKLETIIRNELKISGGFRNPLSAPPKLLYDEVLRASYLSETLLSIILQVWMESHHDLSTLMSAHLDALGIAVIKENAAHGFEDQWFPGQLSEMVNNFKKDHAQFNEDDILLMLCCLTRRGPSTESLVWEQWIEELKSLSYESRVWDMMGGFINMLGQLTSDKLKQREQQAIRTRLEDALTLLRQDAADIIRYFEIKDIAKWSSETCAPKDLESAADQVGRFRETVFTYWKLCQKPVPTLGKRRTRNKELTQMEDAILDTYHQLRSLLTGTKTIGTTTDEPGQDGKQTEEKEAVPAISDKKQVPAQPVSDTKTVSLETVTDEERTPPHKEIRVVSEPGTISDTSPPSIRDPGSRIQADHWNGLLWYLVRANDLPLAYWLTRSLAASDINPDLPPWLLSAVQGARWISYDSHAYIADLQDIAANHCPDSTDAQKLMGLAAALCPALMPHTKGFVSWLEPPKTYPALCQFAEKITQFTQLGIYPEDFLIMAGEDYRKNKFKQISDRARQWLDHAIRKKIKFKNKVWRHLVRTNGKLHTMVWPVVQDARESMEQVRQDMKQWSDPRVAKKCFDDIDHELTGRKPKSIVGCALTQLMNGVEEACEIARRWCDLAEREKKFQAQGSKWLVNQGNQLRAHVREMLPQVETTLADISQSATYSAAGAHCIWIAIRQLQELLQIPLENADIADGKTKWEWVRTDCRKLHHALDRSLILFPEIPLKDNGSPFREAIPKIAPAIRNNGRRTLEDIVGIWLEKQDYRFTDHILRSATEKDSQAERLGRACQTNLNGSRLTLRQKKARAEAAIEQAMADSIISDAEGRTEYSAILASIDPDNVRNFPPKYSDIKKIHDGLSRARQEKLEKLEEEWTVVKTEITQSHMDLPKQEQVHTFVMAELERGNTRVVEECLARLKEVLDTGDDLEEKWYSDQKKEDVLREFRKTAPDIEAWLQHSHLSQVILNIAKGRTHAGIRFGAIPKKRLEEVVSSVSAWKILKQRMEEEQHIIKSVGNILYYLGFSSEPDIEEAIDTRQRGTDWIHLRAAMPVSCLTRPIPQFGSQTRGVYDVVCLWKRPGADTIAARVSELRLNLSSVLIFYLGRLTDRQRRDVVRIARGKELAIALLDETLFLFLARERDTRLRLSTFLRCALPYAALNPYMPFQAGDVPPEIFFGRESMVRELQRPGGSCLVYGGRQLGKSALLRNVQRQFHHPDREKYAWIENMKLIFDPPAGKGTANLWKVLREGFKKQGLLLPRISTNNPDTVIRHIQETMDQKTERQVLVMLDEADDFLDADADDNFRAVIMLRKLMEDTGRRFKVIFAGLHNVQRFQGIPNQPLAHFGAPLCVGPLNPGSARQLITNPMLALGYQVDDSTVFKILSYTNYHPGLIQIFCHELLKRLHSTTQSLLPPYKVEQKDVEAVYRNSEVRKLIQERFEWTLALDTRYQAIVLSLIIEQMEAADNYAHPYSPSDMLKQVRMWWAQGFEEVSLDKLKSLSDEMCGLGVLVRNFDGHYRLRSPNLVRLMGTQEEIMNRLEELEDKQAPTPFLADSHHAPLDDAAKHYSPLTYAQERRLNLPKFGISLVFASDALGLSSLPKAFARFIPCEARDLGICSEIPETIENPDQFSTWLNTHIREHPKHERIFVYYEMTGQTPNTMAEFVRKSLGFCRRRQSSLKQWMRIIFIFPPHAAWTWLSLPKKIREELENPADAVLRPHLWNIPGLRKRLEQNDKEHSDDICESILRATGGWPCLMDHLFDHCKGDNPRSITDEIAKQVSDSDSELGAFFYDALGLEVNTALPQAMNFILRQEQPAREQLMRFLEETCSLGSEECEHAVEYLKKTNCLDIEDDNVSVEPTVREIMRSRT